MTWRKLACPFQTGLPALVLLGLATHSAWGDRPKHKAATGTDVIATLMRHAEPAGGHAESTRRHEEPQAWHMEPFVRHRPSSAKKSIRQDKARRARLERAKARRPQQSQAGASSVQLAPGSATRGADHARGREVSHQAATSAQVSHQAATSAAAPASIASLAALPAVAAAGPLEPGLRPAAGGPSGAQQAANAASAGGAPLEPGHRPSAGGPSEAPIAAGATAVATVAAAEARQARETPNALAAAASSRSSGGDGGSQAAAPSALQGLKQDAAQHDPRPPAPSPTAATAASGGIGGGVTGGSREAGGSAVVPPVEEAAAATAAAAAASSVASAGSVDTAISAVAATAAAVALVSSTADVVGGAAVLAEEASGSAPLKQAHAAVESLAGLESLADMERQRTATGTTVEKCCRCTRGLVGWSVSGLCRFCEGAVVTSINVIPTCVWQSLSFQGAHRCAETCVDLLGGSAKLVALVETEVEAIQALTTAAAAAAMAEESPGSWHSSPGQPLALGGVKDGAFSSSSSFIETGGGEDSRAPKQAFLLLLLGTVALCIAVPILWFGERTFAAVESLLAGARADGIEVTGKEVDSDFDGCLVHVQGTLRASSTVFDRYFPMVKFHGGCIRLRTTCEVYRWVETTEESFQGSTDHSFKIDYRYHQAWSATFESNVRFKDPIGHSNGARPSVPLGTSVETCGRVMLDEYVVPPAMLESLCGFDNTASLIGASVEAYSGGQKLVFSLEPSGYFTYRAGGGSEERDQVGDLRLKFEDIRDGPATAFALQRHAGGQATFAPYRPIKRRLCHWSEEEERDALLKEADKSKRVIGEELLCLTNGLWGCLCCCCNVAVRCLGPHVGSEVMYFREGHESLEETLLKVSVARSTRKIWNLRLMGLGVGFLSFCCLFSPFQLRHYADVAGWTRVILAAFIFDLLLLGGTNAAAHSIYRPAIGFIVMVAVLCFASLFAHGALPLP